MNLSEGFLISEQEDNRLEYLEEYLIVTPILTLTEAKLLLREVTAQMETELAAIVKKIEARKDLSKNQAAAMIAKVRKNMGLEPQEKLTKIGEIKTSLKAKLGKLDAMLDKARAAIKARAKQAGGYVAGKYRTGVALAKANPKTAIGLGLAAGTAAAAGGYAAYRKNKAKKA